MNLRDPETRAAIDLVAKYSLLAIGGIWTLLVGTEFLEKRSAALQFGNAALSIKSIPTASTELDLIQPTDAAPLDGFCYPKGVYRITNTGELPITIQNAKFEIFEVPTILLAADEKVASYSLEGILKDLAPVFSEEIGPSETIGVDNSYERIFGFTIRMDPEASYVLVANAKGGLPELDRDQANARLIIEFGPNDLRHVAQLGALC